MKIVLVSSYVPFIKGGGRFIVEWLEEKLQEYGHQTERFYLPATDDPATLLHQIAAFRLMDLSDAGDRLIALRPPSYVIRHPHKMIWFIHHIRAFYDLWGGPHSPRPTPANDALRQSLVHLDTVAINEARRVFTNSRVVSDRLAKFNGIQSTPLYPPILKPERFRHDHYGDEILVVSRVEPHKRQLLLIEAMSMTRSNVRLRLVGTSSGEEYSASIRHQIAKAGLSDRVTFDDRWIGEEEKADVLAGALAVAYAPIDEDGIGYPSFEAAHARKALITTTDAGAVLEFATDGVNGFVVDPDPRALAEAMDRLYRDRTLAKRLGEANHARLSELAIDWSHVVEAFTS